MVVILYIKAPYWLKGNLILVSAILISTKSSYSDMLTKALSKHCLDTLTLTRGRQSL